MIGKSKLFRKVVPLRNLIVWREKVGRTEWLQKEKSVKDLLDLQILSWLCRRLSKEWIWLAEKCPSSKAAKISHTKIKDFGIFAQKMRAINEKNLFRQWWLWKPKTFPANFRIDRNRQFVRTFYQMIIAYRQYQSKKK